MGKGNKGGNHDASEWLILHVVIPDTVAASEPRWRESSRDSEELKERKQGVKLPGKSTRTVFDKLRADFNESGKSAMDRIAQIRLPKDQLPPDLLPTPPQAATLEETFEEREQAWSDLMNKFKQLILDPFDKRVYETIVVVSVAYRRNPFSTWGRTADDEDATLEDNEREDDALTLSVENAERRRHRADENMESCSSLQPTSRAAQRCEVDRAAHTRSHGAEERA